MLRTNAARYLYAMLCICMPTYHRYRSKYRDIYRNINRNMHRNIHRHIYGNIHTNNFYIEASIGIYIGPTIVDCHALCGMLLNVHFLSSSLSSLPYFTAFNLYLRSLWLISYHVLYIHSFIHSGNLYSASSKHYYSEALPAQSRPKKKDLREM